MAAAKSYTEFIFRNARDTNSMLSSLFLNDLSRKNNPFDAYV